MTIGSILKGIGSRLLSEKIIVRSKRTIFMTTLYLKMAGIYTPSKDTLEECNKRLGLVCNVDALKLPAVLQDTIWDRTASATLEKVDKEISRGDINGVCQRVIAITPRWLRYGSHSDAMRHDIEAIANCVIQRKRALV